MFITLLTEPRAGSTNFANWFFGLDFIVLYTPSDPLSKWYQNGVLPKEYIYKTKNILVKEDFYPEKNFDELIKISDKVILLYRENEVEQIESWVEAKRTGNFDQPYRYKNIINDKYISNSNYFKLLKSEFYDRYLKTDEFFKISYEELYYNNGIDRVINYLGLEKYNKFPIGSRYRIFTEINTFI